MFEKQLWRSDNVRLLEEEVSRLRAENRALMNSLLGTAGFLPLEFPEAPKLQPLLRSRKRSWPRCRCGAKRKRAETHPQALKRERLRERMDLYRTAESWTGIPGTIAPPYGNLAAGAAPATSPIAQTSGVGPQHAAPLLGTPEDLGPNNKHLDAVKPQLENTLRELVWQYRRECIAARLREVRRIRQARLSWQGLQYARWNPNDMNWHLPFEQRSKDDRELEEKPRYQFVTKFVRDSGCHSSPCFRKTFRAS